MISNEGTGSGEQPITTTLNGQRYTGTRSSDHVPDGCWVERYPQHGIVGSDRAWTGSTWAKTTRWWAAHNPTGRPGEATERIEGLASRRAALRWLFERDHPSVRHRGRGGEGDAPNVDRFVDLAVCQDCLMIIANDDGSGIADEQAHRARMASGLERLGGGMLGVGNVDDAADEAGGYGFRAVWCDLCADERHGDRYAAHLDLEAGK